MKNRIDYMTEFPFVASYLAKEFSNMDEYTTLSIDEVSPYGTVHMSCPKTVWGKAVITDINLALEKLRGTQAYKNIFEKRLDPSSLVLYKQYYNQQLLNK
jgi:uncharacterized protein (TIGR02285 family)